MGDSDEQPKKENKQMVPCGSEPPWMIERLKQEMEDQCGQRKGPAEDRSSREGGRRTEKQQQNRQAFPMIILALVLNNR